MNPRVTKPSGPIDTNVLAICAQQDSSFTQTLVEVLNAEGFNTALVITDAVTDPSWGDKLSQSIADADTILLMVTQESIKSGAIARQLNLCMKLNKRLIPLIIEHIAEDLVPAQLGQLNWFFFQERDKPEALTLLTKALRVDLGWIREHNRVGNLAMQWAALDHRNGLLLRGKELRLAEIWLSKPPREAGVSLEHHQDFIRASRRAATMRSRRLTAASAAVTLLSFVIAAAVTISGRRDSIQRDIAFKQSRTTTAAAEPIVSAAKDLRAYIIPLLRRTLGVPSATLKHVVESAIQLENSLSEIKALSPNNVSHAEAIVELSKTLLVRGDSEGAFTAGKQALSILQPAPSEGGFEQEWVEEAIISSNQSIAYALVAQRNLPGAEQYLRESLKILSARIARNVNSDGMLLTTDLDLADVQVDQDKATDAQKLYDSGRSLVEKLAPRYDTDQTLLQVNNSRLQQGFGRLKLAQSNFVGALQSFHAGLALDEKRAAQDSTSAILQHNLATSLIRVGIAMEALKTLPEALGIYQRAVAILELLERTDPENASWQSDLASSFLHMGNIWAEEANVENAQNLFRKSLEIAEKLAELDRKNVDWQNNVDIVVRKLRALVHGLIIDRKFPTALDIAEKSLSTNPDRILLQIERAHCLMFLDRTEEAQNLYSKYLGKGVLVDSVLVDDIVRSEFLELRGHGLTHPLMSELGL